MDFINAFDLILSKRSPKSSNHSVGVCSMDRDGLEIQVGMAELYDDRNTTVDSRRIRVATVKEPHKLPKRVKNGPTPRMLAVKQNLVVTGPKSKYSTDRRVPNDAHTLCCHTNTVSEKSEEMKTSPFPHTVDSLSLAGTSVLTPNLEGGEGVRAYLSSKFGAAQRIILLAIIFLVKSVRPFVKGVGFTIMTEKTTKDRENHVVTNLKQTGNVDRKKWRPNRKRSRSPGKFTSNVVMDRAHAFQQNRYEKDRDRYNLRATKRVFQLGQEVWIPNHKQSKASEKFTSKLAQSKVRAYIEKKLGEDTYMLIDKTGKSLGKYHANDISTR